MLLKWKMFLSTVTKLGASGLAPDTHLLEAEISKKLGVGQPFLPKIEF